MRIRHILRDLTEAGLCVLSYFRENVFKKQHLYHLSRYYFYQTIKKKARIFFFVSFSLETCFALYLVFYCFYSCISLHFSIRFDFEARERCKVEKSCFL